MITMEKSRELEPPDVHAWVEQRGDAIMKINEIPKRVFEVMEKDADGNPCNPEWLRERKPYRGKLI
jgi:hypothetical protein